MEDFDINCTSQANSCDHSILKFNDSVYSGEAGFIFKVVTCIIICIGLPLTLTAIYALFSLV